jgi:uncharacterized surface protein with fasciclin (FAS1) repeats
MSNRPNPARTISGISCGPRSFTHLAGLLIHAVLLSVLLLHAAACDGPEKVHIVDVVDSSDTRTKDLVALSGQIDSLNRFVGALEQAGLVRELESYGPWTVFAPVDRAFGRASARLDTIRRGGLSDSLQKIMHYHIVRGRIDTSDVSNARGDSLRVATVFEKPVTMHLRNGVLTAGNDQIEARVLRILEAQNGILFIINEVLSLPPPDTTAQSEILFF